MGLIKIDDYDLDDYCIVDGLEETFTLLEGYQSQRKMNQSMFYDITGTEFRHTVLIRKNPNLNIANWNKLWRILSDPVDFHKITIDRGFDNSIYNPDSSNIITYNAHISTGKRSLEYIDSSGNKHWGDYSIEFIPEYPQILS